MLGFFCSSDFFIFSFFRSHSQQINRCALLNFETLYLFGCGNRWDLIWDQSNMFQSCFAYEQIGFVRHLPGVRREPSNRVVPHEALEVCVCQPTNALFAFDAPSPLSFDVEADGLPASLRWRANADSNAQIYAWTGSKHQNGDWESAFEWTTKKNRNKEKRCLRFGLQPSILIDR